MRTFLSWLYVLAVIWTVACVSWIVFSAFGAAIRQVLRPNMTH